MVGEVPRFNNKPRSKTTVSNRLNHPYIASKLRKLQDVHEATENLMDELNRQNLQGKNPTRVRRQAKNPGPRTKKQRRQFYESKNSPPSEEDKFVTLVDAAAKLDYKAEKSVTRLIDSGELKAKYRTHDRKRRRMIKQVDLNRYAILADPWYQAQFGSVPTLDGQGNFGVVFVCGPWKKRASARLPRYTLTVSIKEFWQFSCAWPSSEADYEELKGKIRVKLPSCPNDFQVRFVFDQTVQKEIERLVRVAKCPHLKSIGHKELQKEAFMHVALKVLPCLMGVKKNWRAYIVQSVKHFYIDKARSAKKRDPLNYVVDAAELDNLWYAAKSGQSKKSD